MVTATSFFGYCLFLGAQCPAHLPLADYPAAWVLCCLELGQLSIILIYQADK